MRACVLILLLAAGPAAALGLLEKEHPLVAKGREAYSAGRYDEALQAFEAAQRERPNDPVVEFNRADALAKLGRTEEAKKAFSRVGESDRKDLQQRAAFNLGNLHAAANERKEALQAYRRALRLDPSDVDARHNLEVVLRNLPPPPPPSEGNDGGTSDGGPADAGADGGAPDAGPPGDGGTSDGGAPDGGDDAGTPDGGGNDAGTDGGEEFRGTGGPDAGAPDAGEDGGAQQDNPGDATPDGGEKQDAGSESQGQSSEDEEPLDAGVDEASLGKDEAERLLDAMKQNEKNLQLWRFQQRKRPRNANEKDW